MRKKSRRLLSEDEESDMSGYPVVYASSFDYSGTLLKSLAGIWLHMYHPLSLYIGRRYAWAKDQTISFPSYP